MCLNMWREWRYGITGADPLIPISSDELYDALNTQFNLSYNSKTIFLKSMDNYYKTTTIEEVRRFLEWSQIDKRLYVPEYYDCPLPTDVAYGMGIFFADGTCGERNWRIVNKNKDVLEKIRKAFNEEFEKENICFKLKLWDSYKKGNITNYGKRNYDLWCLDLYALNPKEFRRLKNSGNRLRMIKEFRNMFYRNKYKKVPAGILESDLNTKKSFLEGVIEGDGTKHTKNTGTITIKGKIGLGGLCKLMKDLDWKFTIMPDKRKEDIYSLYFNKKNPRKTEMKNACDDFSISLWGEINIPGWSDLPFGLCCLHITDRDVYHAINIFVDNDFKVWFIEPMNDKCYRPQEKPNWKPYFILI